MSEPQRVRKTLGTLRSELHSTRMMLWEKYGVVSGVPMIALHTKSGRRYRIDMRVTIDEESGEPLVHYFSADDKEHDAVTFSRKISKFLERFEPVEPAQ